MRLHALRAMETGEAMLLRILPGDGEAPASEGAVTVQNPCLSGGALEIFLEPVLPAPRVVIVGDTPIAHALARLAPQLGLEVAGAATAPRPRRGPATWRWSSPRTAATSSTALRGGLERRVPYVGLVASGVRGAAVVAELVEAGVPQERAEAIDTPAGIDIGARTAEEIALSILARIVAVRRGPAAAAAAAAAGRRRPPPRSTRCAA